MDLNPRFSFFKYQGTGNDFVVFDNRANTFPKENTSWIQQLCDRRFGIGADGLILLEDDGDTDFRMVYYNADGKESSMCGNGGRCIVAFAKYLGIIGSTTTFKAVDGLHKAVIHDTLVTLQMGDVTEVSEKPNHYFLNTGSPHHVQLVEKLEEMDVKKEGAKIRYGLYGKSGSNINFVAPLSEGGFTVRTYERGVENETLSCGTGVTAVAVAMHKAGKVSSNKVLIKTLGGNLEVSFEKSDGVYAQIHLIGETQLVFKGEVACPS